MSASTGRRPQPAASKLGALVLLAAGALTAQPADDKFCQGANDRDNRCEGREEIPVSRPELELRSLVGWREAYERDVELKVRFFLPEPSPVRLEAREIRPEKQYLMRAKASDWEPGRWNVFGPWPTREVLDLEGIPSWKIGVTIEVERDGEPALLPAHLYHGEPPAEAPELELQILPLSDLRRVEWEVLGPGEDGPVPLVSDRLLGDFHAGEPFTVTLETAELPAGWLRFELDARLRGRTDGAELGFDFHLPPDAGAAVPEEEEEGEPGGGG